MKDASDFPRKGVPDYLAMLKRRRFHFLLPAAGVALLAAWIALRMPDIYRSTATVMIEDQEVPAELLPSNTPSFAAQRLEVIRKRVLTTENAARIAIKHALYDGTDARVVLAQRFNNDVRVDLISADGVDPRTQTAIAFTLSFDSEDPAAAQQVVSELVQLFLEENIRSRTDRAADVVDFLGAEAARLEKELLQLESKLATFKTENEGATPDLYAVNVAALDRSQQESTQLADRIAELEKRRVDLIAELSQLEPNAPTVLPNGAVVMDDRHRLEYLLAEHRRVAAIYSEDHPDLVRLNREIETLREALGIDGVDSSSQLQGQLDEAERQLAVLQERYTDDHPEVSRASAVVESLRAQLGSTANGGTEALPTNPAYLVVRTQLQSIEIELRGAYQRREDLERRIAEYHDLISRAPDVEQQYQALARDRATASAKYQDLRARQREAEIARNIASVRQGSRLTLLEPPALPSRPFSPDRVSIILLGLVLGISAGAVTTFAAEIFDKSIHGANALAALTGNRPLAVVPYIRSSSEIRADKRRRVLAGGATLIVLAVFAAYLTGN